MTRDVQLAHAVTGLVYASIVVGVLLAYVRFSLLESRVVLAYASLAPTLLVVTWSMRLSIRSMLWTFLIYTALGAVLTWGVALRNPAHTMFGGAMFALLAICPLLPLLVRSIQPLVFLLLPFILLMFGVGMLAGREDPVIILNAIEKVIAPPSLIVLGLANIAAGFFLARWMLRQGWPVRVIGLAVALGGLPALDQTVESRAPLALAISAAYAAAILQMLLYGALFALFAWLQSQRVVTSEILHTHFLWTTLTIYFEAWAFMQPEFAGTRWTFVLALVLSTITLHLLLLLIRRRPPNVSEQRMLRLRTS